MIRITQECEVKYGHFAEYVEIMEELQAAMTAKGLRPGTSLTPLTGKANVIIWSCDFDSLEQMETEQKRFQSDPDIMKTFRRGAELVVQGSATGMVYQESPHLA